MDAEVRTNSMVRFDPQDIQKSFYPDTPLSKGAMSFKSSKSRKSTPHPSKAITNNDGNIDFNLADISTIEGSEKGSFSPWIMEDGNYTGLGIDVLPNNEGINTMSPPPPVTPFPPRGIGSNEFSTTNRKLTPHPSKGVLLCDEIVQAPSSVRPERRIVGVPKPDALSKYAVLPAISKNKVDPEGSEPTMTPHPQPTSFVVMGQNSMISTPHPSKGVTVYDEEGTSLFVTQKSPEGARGEEQDSAQAPQIVTFPNSESSKLDAKEAQNTPPTKSSEKAALSYDEDGMTPLSMQTVSISSKTQEDSPFSIESNEDSLSYTPCHLEIGSVRGPSKRTDDLTVEVESPAFSKKSLSVRSTASTIDYSDHQGGNSPASIETSYEYSSTSSFTPSYVRDAGSLHASSKPLEELTFDDGATTALLHKSPSPGSANTVYFDAEQQGSAHVRN